MIAVHMGVGHHSQKLEPKYREGERPSWHPHSASGHSITRCSHLMPCWAVPAVMAAAVRQAEEAMHAQGDAMAAVQAAIAAMEVMFGCCLKATGLAVGPASSIKAPDEIPATVRLSRLRMRPSATPAAART